MTNFKQTVKYEIVLGLLTNDLYDKLPNVTMASISQFHDAKRKWQQYAKEFYNENGIYISAIANMSDAVYNEEWGCPMCGEFTVTFHCTANPEFVKDLELYEKGILYITKKLKREFKQHTVTITKLPAEICYLTDEDNLEE